MAGDLALCLGMAIFLILQSVTAVSPHPDARCTIPQMDVAFIQQNQIIERYLMGKLPLKGAQDFERWCRENPDTVAQLGLSDRINSALRLLDAAGEPLPWTEKPLAPWQKPGVFAGVL